MPNYIIEKRTQGSDEIAYWCGKKIGKPSWSSDMGDAVIVHSQERAKSIIANAPQRSRVYTIRDLDAAP